MAAASTESGAEAPVFPDYMTNHNAVLADVSAQWRNTQPPDYSKTRKFFSES